VKKRVLGPEHPSTLSSASNLGTSLSGQGKDAEAERILREMHEVEKRVLGAEHPDTLTSAGHHDLAGSLANLNQLEGKYTEAERMLHAALASLQRVLGPAHPNALTIASSLE
jgi:hypothetical protein